MKTSLRWDVLLAYVFAFLFCVSASTFLVPHQAHAAVLTVVTATAASNNASTTLAKVGNTVTFNLQLSGTPAATSTPTINIFSMGTASMTGSGANWSYSTTTSSSWTNGFLTFSLAWGGSLGESTTTATQTALTGPNVRFDSIVPTITSIVSSASCTGSNGTLCLVGDTIGFTLTPGATEYGGSVAGSYNGRALTWSTSNAGATYTGTYTVASGDATQSALQIAGVVLNDAAGNASTAGAGSDVAVNIRAASKSGSTPITITQTTLFPTTPSASPTPSVPATTTSSTPNAPAPTASNPVSTFARSLRTGSKGSDVMALQVFLNTHGYPVTSSGPGSQGMETSFFGKGTQAALARFQTAHGIAPATGYFGPLTRAFIASMK